MTTQRIKTVREHGRNLAYLIRAWMQFHDADQFSTFSLERECERAITAAVREAVDEERQGFHARCLEWRGVEVACAACGGTGQRSYGSTATWRGGCGGQAITQDVCDRCWGTGDANRHGANLRELTARARAAADKERG